MAAFISSWKKLIGRVLLVAFVTNIFAPVISYAALPTFDVSLVTANQYPVAQVEEITLPRDPVAGDLLSLTVSGSTVTQSYDTSVALTLQFFGLKIDALPGVGATVDASTRKLTIISEIPGASPNVGNLIITRWPIIPVTTVNNIVAVAQESEVMIPQDIFAGDVLQFTVSGTGLTQVFTGSTDATLSALADQISLYTSASGSYDVVTRKIHLIAKIAGQAFSMSNLVITSLGMTPQNVVANVVPVAQVEKISLPRILYSDETLAITVAGSGIIQGFVTDTNTTLTLLAAQIDALNTVDAAVSGSDIVVTAHAPGVPFTIGNLTITGGTLSWINVIPNRVAVAQVDAITVPRDLFVGDAIHFRLNNINVTQNFSGSTTGTLDAFAVLVSSIANVEVTNINYITRTITITSEVPGTPFATQGLYLTSVADNINVSPNVTPVAQVNSLTFDRAFLPGDIASFVVDGNTLIQTYSGTSNATYTALTDQIDAMASVNAMVDVLANKITVTASNPGIGFSISDATVTNAISPVVLVANVVPVKQKNTFQLPQILLSGEVVAMTISGEASPVELTGMSLSQLFDFDIEGSFNALVTQIDSLLSVDASADFANKEVTITAATAGQGFTPSLIISTSAPFVGNTVMANAMETKASVSLNLNALPINGEYFTLGTCTVNFVDTGAVDTDCSNNNARINVGGITDVETVAAILRWLSGVHDDYNGVLETSGTGMNIIYTRVTTQDTLSTIVLDTFFMNGKMDVIATPAPAIPVAQIDHLPMMRDFAPGDTLSVQLDGITVTQNYTSSSGVSLTSFVNQLDALPSVSATLTGSTIILEASQAGTAFALGVARFVNTQISQVSVSNTLAVAQKEILNFPVILGVNEQVKMKINGTNIEASGTYADVVNAINTSISGEVVATLSGSQAIEIESAVAGQSFTIDNLELVGKYTPTLEQANISGEAQIDTLTLPVLPVADDVIVVSVNGTTLTQAFSTDAASTLALLNTQIDNLATVNSSVDTTTGVFTITSATAGVPFTASFVTTGATIDGTTLVENTGAQAQVDVLSVNRQIVNSDTLTLTLWTTSVTESYSGSDVATLAALATDLNVILPEVTTTFSASGMIFNFTANTPGTPFTHPVLQINSLIPSINQVANVFAVAQVDRVTLQRSLLVNDTLTLTLDGVTYTQAFTGSEANTLTALQTQINTSSGATLSAVGGVLTFTAKTPGVPFALAGFILTNSVLPVTTTQNVAPVKQQTEFILPTFIQGDIIAFSLNSVSVMQPFTWDDATTITAILAQVNAIGAVDATFSGQVMNFTARVAGTPFTLSNATVTNTTTPVITVVNVPAVSQVVDFTPNGPVIEGLTYRVTINGTNYDYLTGSGDTLPNIVNNLRSTITGTEVIATATGSSNEILRVTAAQPGTPFTYAAAVLDITAPIASAPVNIPQALKSGDVSTSTVESNEDGIIYLVLAGTTTTTVGQINSAIATGDAFVAEPMAQKDTPYTVTVANGIHDGLYNIVAVDWYANVSQAIPGWLTVDNTSPIVTIGTPAQTTSATQITITGSTNEPNRPFQIVYSGGILAGIVAADGSFSGTVPLVLNTPNVITVNVTDIAGNVGFDSVTIIQDSLIPPLTLPVSPIYTNQTSYTITGTTDPNISVSIEDIMGPVVGTGFSDGAGNFSINIPLNPNVVNLFNVIVTDAGGNTNSGTLDITQDSINPIVILDPVATLVHAANTFISGTTEPFASVVISNGAQTPVNVTASSTGSFAGTIVLTPNSVNTILVTAIDRASNIGTGSVAITEDSIPNALLIHTPSQYVNAANLTISGSTKANSTVVIAWGLSTATGSADASGNFAIDVALTRNAVNIIDVTATDQVGFVATGSIIVTEDSINPTVTLSTVAQTTNNLTLAIQGITEPNALITITGGSGSFAGVSDGSGAFSVNVDLNSGAVNTLVVTATDQAGNNWSANIIITHDPIVIFLNLAIANQVTNQNAFTFTGATKSGATLTIIGWATTVITTADSAGDFSATIVLNQNTINNILVTASDSTSVTATGGFVITHDNIVPIITLGPIPSITSTASISFTGTTEANASITFVQGVNTYNATADGLGVFGVTLPLILNSLNTFVAIATDGAGNIGTGVTIQITQDNLGPIVSNLSVTPVVAGSVMNATYTFNTNETANSIFLVGTGSNVDATLVATGATSGLIHSSVIPGLAANQTYYYYISSTDVAGNVSQTTVAAINSIDTVGPVITAQNVHSILSTSAMLDFTYTDAHFVAPFATGSISITDGTNSQTLTPTLTYSAPSMTGSIAFSSLTPATLYTYSVTLSDNFSNTTTFTGSFMTVAIGVLNGGVITQTGSLQIPTGTGTTQNLNGTSITLHSANGTLIIGTGTTSISFPAGWNGILQPPFFVNPSTPEAATNAEIQPLVTPMNTTQYTYAPNVIETIGVGGFPAPVTSIGSPFTVVVKLISNQISQTLNVYRSNDGATWQANIPTGSCVVASDNTCTFQTNSLGYFALTQIIRTSRSTGGGGGGWWWTPARDTCPNGDYSPSYYDGTCGTAPAQTQTSTGSTSTGVVILPNLGVNIGLPVVTNSGANLNTDATGYILKIIDVIYPKLTSTNQKIALWQKVIDKMKSLLASKNLTENQKILYTLVKEYAEKLQKKLIESLPVMVPMDSKIPATQVPSVATKPVIPEVITLDKPGVIQEQKEGYIPASSLTTLSENFSTLPALPDMKNPIYGGWKYVNAEHSQAVRFAPSYRAAAFTYLPRNFKIEVTNLWALWSEISLENKSVFVRTKYLRDMKQSDAVRNDPFLFQNLSQYTDVDVRKVWTYALNVRKRPNADSGVKNILRSDTQVVIVDRVDGWYEVRYPDGMSTGWIRSKFVR